MRKKSQQIQKQLLTVSYKSLCVLRNSLRKLMIVATTAWAETFRAKTVDTYYKHQWVYMCAPGTQFKHLMTTNALHILIYFGKYMVQFIPKASSAITKNRKFSNRTCDNANYLGKRESEICGFLVLRFLIFSQLNKKSNEKIKLLVLKIFLNSDWGLGM